MAAVDEKVKQIIVEQLGVDEGEVTPSASFVDDLGADSLDTVELVMAFEEAFNIEIPDEAAEKIQKVKDAIEYIEGLIDQSGGFGCMLLLGHEWANPEATKRSWELIAQHVMPHFQGGAISHAQQTLDAKAYATGKREDYAAAGRPDLFLREEWAVGLDEAIEMEAQAQAICMQTRDFRRAYEAFVAKKKPVFEGD